MIEFTEYIEFIYYSLYLMVYCENVPMLGMQNVVIQ